MGGGFRNGLFRAANAQANFPRPPRLALLLAQPKGPLESHSQSQQTPTWMKQWGGGFRQGQSSRWLNP